MKKQITQQIIPEVKQTVVEYICEHCNKKYDEEQKAIECEMICDNLKKAANYIPKFQSGDVVADVKNQTIHIIDSHKLSWKWVDYPHMNGSVVINYYMRDREYGQDGWEFIYHNECDLVLLLTDQQYKEKIKKV